MRKLIIAIALVSTMLTWSSCAKNFEDMNVDLTQFTEVSPEAALQGSFKRLNDFMGNANYSRYWDMANLVNATSRYGGEEGGMWQNAYVFVLEPINQIKLTFGADPGFNNRIQIARIWEAYTYSYLVATFGPIPCSQANNRDYLATVKFDDEDSVYAFILNTLKDAASKIDVAKTQDRLTYDAIYGASATSIVNWKKFANTLRLKIALRCSKNLPQLAEQHAREVMSDEANTIIAESETTKMLYENVIGNENPHFLRFKRNSYTLDPPTLNDYLFVNFRSYKDPRLDAYYDSVPLANAADRYLLRDTMPSRNDDSLRVVDYRIPHFGRPKSPAKLPGWSALNGLIDPLGQNVKITSYSRLKGYGWTQQASGEGLTAPDRPFIILSYAESQLLKAEAAALGFGGSKTAEQYYNEGIDANFAYWKISNAQRDAYKQRDGIKWGTAGIGFIDYVSIVKADIPADPLSKIYIQQWINYFPDQAFDVWCLQRRTRTFDFSPHTNPGSGVVATPWMEIPMRASYPTNVINLNPDGYQDGLQKLGGLQNDINPLIPLKFTKAHESKNWNNVPVAYSTRYMQKWYGDYVEDLKTAGITYTLISTFKP
ncbi:SusD/RagB family nutrient-binding outer membrane lipoprotein [Paraflavitalea sp. CAU 1676]|uniref:SusD/RagB family nutrient-binding outer membrane lipoprotein n=1 Tax=Paraflavitalea sp. CAU 1676 TaxID=3032598 RepID=UPI0023DA7489|nr:SusD/RagB family nutrient-binding outer membrane lipoprotein [Paraflavitalea sp. CAU 1676]MDF2192397.1 SusD/RagB family nutrient-binding outer membrane lipoprotein [Paraflavitalea sp. CAU 1676]